MTEFLVSKGGRGFKRIKKEGGEKRLSRRDHLTQATLAQRKASPGKKGGESQTLDRTGP